MPDGIQITVVGNLVDDPELRYTPGGDAVASFTVANNTRRYDNKKKEWVQGATSFVRCNLWREQAENTAESLKKGDRVIVTGMFAQRSYTNKDDEKRTIWEMTVAEIGAALRFATVVVQQQEKEQTKTRSRRSSKGEDDVK